MRQSRAVLLSLALVLLPGSAVADYSSHVLVRQYIEEVAAEHDFPADELTKLFAAASKKQAILDAIARPAEKTWQWHEYRGLFLQPERIEEGVAFWEENRQALQRAQARFGVPPEYIVAIIGVETRYGRIVGRYRVIDALTTLAFDYPPRWDFFRRELTQFLLLAREEGKDPLTPVGSYAGAMGYGQFIPSSYRRYAVDFNGDGVRDIWTDRTDAIGSVANYFAEHGWRGGEPVIVPVDGVTPELDALANTDLALTHTVGDLKARGLLPRQPLADDTQAALFRFEDVDGPLYHLGLNDFYVITRYNHSRLYALAVHELSQAIRSLHEERTE